MSRLDAFKDFMLKADLQLSYNTVLRNCWWKACEWQKEQDMSICYDINEFGEAKDCAASIRNQDD